MKEKVKLEACIDKSVYSFQVSPRASQVPAHRLMVIKVTVANTNPSLPEASLEDVPPAQWPRTEGEQLVTVSSGRKRYEKRKKARLRLTTDRKHCHHSREMAWVKNKLQRTGDVVHWLGTCLACRKSWVQSLAQH